MPCVLECSSAIAGTLRARSRSSCDRNDAAPHREIAPARGRHAADARDVAMAGPAGFEPAAFGFVVRQTRLPADHRASLSVVFPQERDPACSLPSRAIPVDNADFGAPVVRNRRPGVQVKSDLLTVREAAALLRVCTATVYYLCERGELPCIRVSRLIRIPASDLETLLRATREEPRRRSPKNEEQLRPPLLRR
jgi:excisionase family DNA binding protein